MCTVTLEYEQSNALARRKLAALLATGLFIRKDFQPDEAHKPTVEEVEAHRQLREAVLEHSRKTMSHVIARYVWNITNETLYELMNDEQRDFLDTITNYNIEARYPEDKEELAKTLTKDFCRQIIDETKQLQQWIKDRL